MMLHALHSTIKKYYKNTVIQRNVFSSGTGKFPKEIKMADFAIIDPVSGAPSLHDHTLP